MHAPFHALYKKIAHVHTSTSTHNPPILFNELAEQANVGEHKKTATAT